MEHNLELHSLMTDMQLAYYFNLRYRADGTLQNAREALDAMKSVAKRAITEKRIPRSLFMYAKVFLVSPDPMTVVEKAYQVYSLDNPGEVDADGNLALQA